MAVSTHTLSLQQTLKGVESKLQFLESTSHLPQQTEELQTLTKLKQTLLREIQASIESETQQQPSLSLASIPTMQKSSSVAASTTLTMPQTTFSQKQQPQVVLTKPRTSMPPTFMMPAATESNNKILNKQRLQELIKEIDPTEQLDEDVEEMLMQITDDFIESVVSASCDLAKHRKSNTLEVKDLKLHLEQQWNILVPGYGSDEIRPFKKAASTDAHKQRLAIIRRAVKK